MTGRATPTKRALRRKLDPEFVAWVEQQGAKAEFAELFHGTGENRCQGHPGIRMTFGDRLAFFTGTSLMSAMEQATEWVEDVTGAGGED